MLIYTRRHLGAVKHFLKNASYHLKFSGPDYPKLSRRMIEQFILLVNNGMTPQEYYRLGLFRKNMTWREKRGYLGHYMMKRSFGFINPAKNTVLAKDKSIFHMLASSMNLPTAEMLASYDKKQESRPWQVIHNREELKSFLLDPKVENVFVKPDNLQQGVGSFALAERIDEHAWRELPDGNRISFDQVLQRMESFNNVDKWLFQRLIKPSPFTMQIVENVVCTVSALKSTSFFSLLTPPHFVPYFFTGRSHGQARTPVILDSSA